MYQVLYLQVNLMDVVLDAVNQERYTYFIALYGRDYKHQTGILDVKHDFEISVKDLHILIRQRTNEVLGEDTPCCYQIFALAAPEPMPCTSQG